MSEPSRQESRVPGISALAVYLPAFRVDLQAWCDWTGNSWDKISAVVGRSFRLCGPHENVYTMAANAVLRLIVQNRIDPRRIGFLGLGTESSTDNAAGAVIVRGMLDRALVQLGLPRLGRSLEVPEFKHACLGGIYALKSALRYVVSDGADRLAIVVSADQAQYERGSTGEQTQGAGAVAMLVERIPRLLAIDLRHAGVASAYRGPDFRKPVARHFMDQYPARGKPASDFPVFSGKYSTTCYLDATVHAVEDMLQRLGMTADRLHREAGAWFFHRPYHLMPVQALALLHVRAMAQSDPAAELRALCAEAQVDPDALLAELGVAPDLHAALEAGNRSPLAYVNTSAVAAVLRRRPGFKQLVRDKMSLGAEAAKDFGNLYSAALPAWIAAGLDEACAAGRSLTGTTLLAIGYGSGDAAEALPFSAVPGWEQPAGRIGLARALDGAVSLSRAQYEALHDRRELPGITSFRRGEFAITGVGTTYEPGFQDLGVESYQYRI